MAHPKAMGIGAMLVLLVVSVVLLIADAFVRFVSASDFVYPVAVVKTLC